MDHVDVERLDQVEHALTRRMVEVLTLDTHALILDMTNFAMFIDSANEGVPVAQRGKGQADANSHARSDRHDPSPPGPAPRGG
jgi:hypothetical protein